VVAIVGTAGCTGGQDGGGAGTATPTSSPMPADSSTPTDTPTPTESPSPSPTPQPASFEVVSTDVPRTITVGDQFQITAKIRNRGDLSGTFETLLEAYDPNQNKWVEVRTISLEVPGGETRTWESNQVTATREQAGPNFRYRLKDTTAKWEFTIEPASRAPQVQEVNLVEEWDAYGDAIDKAINSAPTGEEITIAWRYDYIVMDGTLHVLEQCRIYNVDSGHRVGNQTYVDEQIYSQNGYSTFEHGLRFDTTDWDPGEYRAEVTLRDEVSGEVSNTEPTTFELI